MTDLSVARVEALITEYEENGPEQFSVDHGVLASPPREYWFISPYRLSGGVYPTKPLAAAALGWPDINGGYAKRDSACNLLERAGYVITDRFGSAINSSGQEIAPGVAFESWRGRDQTERSAIVLQRVGQDLFRGALIHFWAGRCAVTGLRDQRLLRASHIKPWAVCDDRERLDVGNGLLLSALWDSAFDAGLVSFSEEGRPFASRDLSSDSRRVMQFDDASDIKLAETHLPYLAWHRRRYGF